MNIKQRIVLILGASALLYVTLTSPKISLVKGTYVIPPPDKRNIARIIDVGTAMTRAVAVLGASLLVAIALKDKKNARTQSGGKGLVGGCQEGETESLRKNIIPKIVRFLKDFF